MTAMVTASFCGVSSTCWQITHILPEIHASREQIFKSDKYLGINHMTWLLELCEHFYCFTLTKIGRQDKTVNSILIGPDKE